MSPEFNLIKQYFTRPTNHTLLGVGDDAALVQTQVGMQLAISADMLVSGTHFFADTDAYKLGWKSLAVNISDMAAMGAQPKWATLAIALPAIDEKWLAAFSQGFFACADTFNVDLIGGDTTRGPLTISVQIMGEVGVGKSLRRDHAKVGDQIWVSGELGTAALALNALMDKLTLDEKQLKTYRKSLEQPEPRVALGLALRDIANSAIDISDGLLSDLGHILEQSEVSAEIYLNDIPCNEYVSSHLHEEPFQKMLLAGGDDYELCFTAPIEMQYKIKELSKQLSLKLTHIGHIIPQKDGASKVVVSDDNGNIIEIKETGFDHFA